MKKRHEDASCDDQVERENLLGEADDVSDLYEAMMHRTATGDYGGEDDTIRNIIKRMECRKKAAKKWKTLEMMCATCGKCE
jgi:hypothetical protein